MYFLHNYKTEVSTLRIPSLSNWFKWSQCVINRIYPKNDSRFNEETLKKWNLGLTIRIFSIPSVPLISTFSLYSPKAHLDSRVTHPSILSFLPVPGFVDPVVSDFTSLTSHVDKSRLSEGRQCSFPRLVPILTVSRKIPPLCTYESYLPEVDVLSRQHVKRGSE